MNRMYEFMLKLQDMFSPQLMKMANTYGKVVGNMERKKRVIGGVFQEAGQSVENLRRKLLGLSGTSTRVSVDTSQIDAASRKASKLRAEINRLSGGGGGGGSSGGGSSGGESGGMLSKIMRGGALGAMLGGYLTVQGAGAALGSTVAPAMEANRNQFSMGVMMHSPESAKILTDQLRNYAAQNPLLGNEEVQSMGTQMVGLGYKMEQILPVMKSLGDVAAGSGNNLADLVLVLGQVKMKGRLQAEELMQFAERRVNLMPYLAQVKGVKENQISQMVTDKKVSYQDVEKAIGMMSGQGGIFENMSERTAKETPFGKYQQMLGDIDNKALEIGTALLPYVEKIMTFVNELLANIGPLEKGFGRFTSAVGQAWTFVSGLLANLGLISDKGSAAQLIMESLGTVFNFFGNVIRVVTRFLEYFTNNPLLMLLTGMAALPMIISLVSSAWVALNVAFAATPIGFIIAAVVGIIAALMTAYDKVDWFREGLIKVWETAKAVFSNIGSFLKMLFTGDVVGAIGVIGKTFAEAKTNGMDAVVADRNQRLVANVPKAVQGGFDGGVAPGGPPPVSGGGGGSSGISSTVGNSKSQNVTINVGSLIAKSEINVMDFDGDISQLESKIIEALSRLIHSANQVSLS